MDGFTAPYGRLRVIDSTEGEMAVSLGAKFLLVVAAAHGPCRLQAP